MSTSPSKTRSTKTDASAKVLGTLRFSPSMSTARNFKGLPAGLFVKPHGQDGEQRSNRRLRLAAEQKAPAHRAQAVAQQHAQRRRHDPDEAEVLERVGEGGEIDALECHDDEDRGQDETNDAPAVLHDG